MNSTETYYENFTTTTPGVNRRKPHAALFGGIAKGLGIAREEKEEGVNEKQAHDEASSTHDQATEEAEKECSLSTFPEWVISGVPGDFARLYSEYIEPPLEFFFISFLTCLGNVLADSLAAASEIDFQPRLYVLLLGESADDRKSTAIKKTIQFFESFFNGSLAGFLTQGYFNPCWGIGSAEGLQKVLTDTPKTLLAYDEFKALIDKCRISGSVLLTALNTLFENNNTENHTKTSSCVLDGVYLSLLAASTIPTYNRTWDSTFTDIGLTNRLFLVPARSRKRIPIPQEIPHRKKQEIALKLNGILHIVNNGGANRLRMTPGANRRYAEWYNNRETSIHMKRLEVYATRLMLLLAVSDYKTEIDEETVEKALALVDWQLEVRREHDPIDAETKVARLEEQIRRKLRKERMKHRDLRRAISADRVGIRYFNWALSNLISARDVILESDGFYELSKELCEENI